MIFTIEKRHFRRGGKLHETRSYYLRYRLGDMPVDKWKSLGVKDKQVADKMGHEFIQERERETAGILEPKGVRDSAKKPLTAHLDESKELICRKGTQRTQRSKRAKHSDSFVFLAFLCGSLRIS